MLLDILVKKVIVVIGVWTDYVVRREILGNQVHQVCLVHQVRLDPLVLMDKKEIVVWMALLVHLDCLGSQVQKHTFGLKVSHY